MNFSAAFYTAADAPVQLPAGVTVRPQRWAAHARGGCDDAEIEIDGPREALYTLLSWIGFQAHISNEDGQKVWWGDIEEVEIAVGGVTIGVNLRNFANRIQVRYSARRRGGAVESAETEWQQDNTSADRYGIFERRVNAQRERTDSEAEIFRDNLLATLSTPGKVMRLAGGGQSERATARLYCTGYWQRLRRKYYFNPAGLVEHTPTGAIQPLGLSFVTQWLAWVRRDGVSSAHDVYGRFAKCNYPRAQFVVAGAGNDGPWTIEAAKTKAPVEYTSTQIGFDPDDDITDASNGLSFIEVDDVVLVSGSSVSGNNGLKLVKTVRPERIEISPGWSGGDISSSAAGPSVTIRRGNSLRIVEAVTNERPTTSADQEIIFWGWSVHQTFTVPANSLISSWTVDSVEIRCRRVGNPTDNLEVALYATSGGVPTGELQSVAVAGNTLSDTMDWVSFSFANSTALNTGSVYALMIRRSTDVTGGDPENFYEIETDDSAGYADGVYRVSDKSAWQTPAVNQSLSFRIVDGMDNSEQIRRIWDLAQTGLGTLLIETQSGIVTTQQRNGDLTALDEIEDLLTQGTSTDRQLYVWVSPERNGRLYAPDGDTTADFVYSSADRKLYTAQGDAVTEGLLPVGRWTRLDIGHDLPYSWNVLSPFLVERAEYRVGQGLTLEPSGQRGEVSIGLRAG